MHISLIDYTIADIEEGDVFHLIANEYPLRMIITDVHTNALGGKQFSAHWCNDGLKIKYSKRDIEEALNGRISFIKRPFNGLELI